MKRYLRPLVKFHGVRTKEAFLQASISIHQEVGYSEDAANTGLF